MRWVFVDGIRTGSATNLVFILRRSGWPREWVRGLSDVATARLPVFGSRGGVSSTPTGQTRGTKLLQVYRHNAPHDGAERIGSTTPDCMVLEQEPRERFTGVDEKDLLVSW